MEKESQSKGGKATVARYGKDYMRSIGSKGGKTTATRYGHKYMSSIGKNGASGMHKRYRMVPVGTSQFILVKRDAEEVVQ